MSSRPGERRVPRKEEARERMQETVGSVEGRGADQDVRAWGEEEAAAPRRGEGSRRGVPRVMRWWDSVGVRKGEMRIRRGEREIRVVV